MTKSGLGDSPFFAPFKPTNEVTTPPPSAVPEKPAVEKMETYINNAQITKMANTVAKQESTKKRVGKSKLNDSNNANMQASNNASMHASIQSINRETIIETIRKAVKYVGKDSATYRFTPEEKKALLELSFSFKMQGYKTSENELTRIAINFILEDQKQNGRNSILQRVLDALSK